MDIMEHKYQEQLDLDEDAINELKEKLQNQEANKNNQQSNLLKKKQTQIDDLQF